MPQGKMTFVKILKKKQKTKNASNFVEERKAKPNNLSSAFKAQRAKKRCKNIYLYIYI